MYKLIRPDKDATIYGYAPNANAGIDEVLELNTKKIRDFQASGEEPLDEEAPSRILMQFDEITETLGGDEITNSGGSGGSQPNFEGTDPRNALGDRIGNGPPNAFCFFGEQLAPVRDQPSPAPSPPDPKKYNGTARLRMWFANGRGLSRKYEIRAFPLEKEWREGRGRIENVPPTNEPVSWNEANENQSWDTPGADFDTSVQAEEVFDREDPDLNLNLDPVLSTDPQNGFLLKRKNEDFGRRSELKFFSLETRTIYIPHILLGTDDYEFDPTGSEQVDDINFEAFITNMQNEYRPGSTVRFDVSVREKFEQREFLGIRPTDRASSVEGSKHLPERSLRYEIQDVRTGLPFMPFDERYTSVSFAEGEHFFDVDLTNLLPKRKYEITLRYEDPETGAVKYFDDGQTFWIYDR